MMLKAGPTPADDGTGLAWDESKCSDLFQIFISHDTSKICSLQFQYAVGDGTLVLSQPHGESSGDSFNTVKLNYPSEFITCVDGRFFPGGGISSLTFRTNKGTYGPFGNQDKGEDNHLKFIFHTGEDNQFGGFHGMDFDDSGFDGFGGIKSIGVYIKPLTAIPSQI